MTRMTTVYKFCLTSTNFHFWKDETNQAETDIHYHMNT